MPDTDNVLALALAAVRAGNDHVADDLLRARACQVPADADAQAGLGFMAHRRGDGPFAVACFRRAASVDPSNAAFQINLAVALGGKRAAQPMRRALALVPDLADGHANLAGMDILPGTDQVKWCRRALAAHPAHHAAAINLSLALSRLGRPADAIPAMTAATAATPLSADAHFTLGGLYADCGLLGEAAGSLRRAAALSPKDAGVWLRASRVACSMAVLDAAAVMAERALALDPNDPTAHSNRLMIALYDGRVTPAGLLHLARRRHRGRTRRGRVAGGPHARESRAPLNLAYLSADFRSHPIAYNIAPVIAAHDRRRVRVSCYADVLRRDAMTDSIAGMADRWIDVTGRDDAAVAEAIARDRIDILVILGGHTANNRLGIADLRAAPVQISLLDVASSGSPDVDLIVLDPFLAAPGVMPSLSEEAALVSCLFCFTSPEDAPPPERRTGDGSLVFASFSNPSKIGADTAALWGPLLRALPRSTLVLKYKNLYADHAVQEIVADRLAAAGIGRDRIRFVSDLDTRRGHLDLYRDVDIALDPVPFNGCTTTFEALWMGVPVLTATADRIMGRMGASILTAAGLADLIAPDPAAFASTGLALARDPARRATLRKGLRDRLRRSRLIDGRPLAAELEDLFDRIVAGRRAA